VLWAGTGALAESCKIFTIQSAKINGLINPAAKAFKLKTNKISAQKA